MKVGNVLNIRDRRERERQKVIQVYWISKLIKTNNSARQCITFFSISLSSLHNYETKWPNFNLRLLSISESPSNTLCEERGKEGGKRKEERGKRKEERGKRKEERGKRKEERGKRKRKLKKVLIVTNWRSSFSEPSVNQTLNLRSIERFRIAWLFLIDIW